MTDKPFESAHISDVVRRGSRMAVREHFGVEAFGVNAFTADAGDGVINDHNEGADGHQELYVVTSGRAHFTLGERELDAPTGTVIFTREPLLRRKATAEESGTTVLAVGAPRGKAYEISPWEVFTEFWPRYEAKDYEGAIESLREALKRYPENRTILYNIACCESLLGRQEDALEHLRVALEQFPEMAGVAREDDDFAAVRDDPRFQELTSRSPETADEQEQVVDGDGFAAAALSDVQTQGGNENSTWIRIRRHFDVGSFGVNAYRAEESGGRVIEEHTEENLGHQELYFVLDGRAVFAVGDEEIDAPTGTFVFIRDPETRRGALAQEPGTTVLAVGARPGTAFDVSPWEEFADAFPYFQTKEYDRAIEIFQRGLEKHPDHPSGLYNLACCESLTGDTEAALEHLARAVERDARFRDFARSDEDFAAIRDDPRFAAAVAA